MILPSDKEYIQTKRIMLGEEKMQAEFLPLAAWIDKTYHVKTINIIYDTIDEGKRPRLQICFEFEKEQQRFLNKGKTYFNKIKQDAIASYFKEMLLAQELVMDMPSSGISATKAKQLYLTEDIWVVYGAFEPVAKLEATYKISTDQIKAFQHSFNNPDIWEISVRFTTATFFLYTNKKVKEYDLPGIKKEWADKYFEFVKEYDEFNYFKRETTQIFLDSKENFDNNYQSNWYYYYK